MVLLSGLVSRDCARNDNFEEVVESIFGRKKVKSKDPDSQAVAGHGGEAGCTVTYFLTLPEAAIPTTEAAEQVVHLLLS